MAGTTSGSFSTTRVSGKYTFTLYWTITSQGRENGTTPYSMVSFAFKGSKNSSTQRWWDLDATHTFTVDGSTLSSGRCSFDSRNWATNTEYTIWSSSSDVKVYHNAAGSKTMSTYFTLTTTGTDVGTFTVGGDAVLLDIPMAGTLSLSASSVTISSGSTPSVTASVGSYVSSLYYRLVWYIGGTGVQQVDFQASSYSYSFTPSTWGNAMPNTKTVTATAYLYTYSDSGRTNVVGSASYATCSVTYTIPPTVGNPTASPIGYSTGRGLSGYYTGQTGVRISAGSFSGSNGAGLSSYTYFVSGAAQSTTATNYCDIGSLTSAGTIYLTVRYTDTRGNYADGSTSISVEAYSTPKITSYNAYRVTSGSTPDTSGTKIYYTATSSAIGSGNYITGMSVATTPTATQSTASGASYTMSGTLNGAFSITQTYTVQFTATDQMGYSSTASLTVQTAERIINVKANKKGIAFGKFADQTSAGDNLIDSAWSIKTRASGMDGVLVSHGEVADASVQTYRTDINKGVSLVTGASGARGIYLNGEEQWLINTDGVSVGIPKPLYLGSSYTVGNFGHPNAGNRQYQAVVNDSFAATSSWQTVSNLILYAPNDGLYAIEASALYSNSQPSGVAIITRSASSSYNDYRAIVDRGASGLTDGTTQYLNCSCVAYLGAGDVALVRVRYAWDGNNYIRLRMWLL